MIRNLLLSTLSMTAGNSGGNRFHELASPTSRPFSLRPDVIRFDLIMLDSGFGPPGGDAAAAGRRHQGARVTPGAGNRGRW
jgi:hypothetical protein